MHVILQRPGMMLSPRPVGFTEPTTSSSLGNATAAIPAPPPVHGDQRTHGCCSSGDEARDRLDQLRGIAHTVAE